MLTPKEIIGPIFIYILFIITNMIDTWGRGVAKPFLPLAGGRALQWSSIWA